MHVPGVRTIRTTASHSPPAILAAHPELRASGLGHESLLSWANHGVCSGALRSSQSSHLLTLAAAMHGSSQPSPSTPNWSRDSGGREAGRVQSSNRARAHTARARSLCARPRRRDADRRALGSAQGLRFKILRHWDLGTWVLWAAKPEVMPTCLSRVNCNPQYLVFETKPRLVQES